jgi:hypothetical protein
MELLLRRCEAAYDPAYRADNSVNDGTEDRAEDYPLGEASFRLTRRVLLKSYV